MLTKDLIRARVYNGSIKPQFVDPQDSQLQILSKKLLAIYNANSAPQRNETEEMVMAVVNSFHDIRLAKGLNKIILDKCEFGQTKVSNCQQLRAEIFANSAKLLSSEISYKEFSNKIKSNFPTHHDFLDDIYADLPANETLLKAPDFFPRELLERYNSSLVQSLLLHCQSLTINLVEADAAKLRRLFKYLKFFRLLATITRANSAKKITLTIAGPASMISNTAKYGLQLASFFPAICALTKWKMQAEVTYKNRKLMLKLSQKDGLVSHYRNFSAFIPEEIRLFHELFKEKGEDWQIATSTPLIEAKDGEILFPDLSFKHKDGNEAHLELFHRWHSDALLKRLQFCEKNTNLKLLIGVDRILLGKSLLKDAIDSSEYFQKYGFLFRDFPPITRVNKLLSQQIL